MDKNQQKIHEDFVRFGGQAKEWTRKCILLLPEIERGRIWEKKGFNSIYEYAAKLAGMNRDKVNDALRILEKIADKPALRQVVEQKGLGAVRPVVTIATVETAAFWAEKAGEMAKNTLETYVKEYKKFCPRTESEAGNSQQQAVLDFESKKIDRDNFGVGQDGDNNLLAGRAEFKKIVAMELEPEIVAQLEKLKGQGDWNDLIKQLLQMRVEKLDEQKPEAVKTKSRHIPRKIQRYVMARTNGTCAFPSCKNPMKIKHHTQRFALEKIHDPERLYGLCKDHEQIAHHGLIENENLRPERWRVGREAERGIGKYQIDRMVMEYRRDCG